jgi:Cof subfamily protein (haloacid dehalogenase superfamily)
MIRLIAADMDGTLMDDNKMVGEEFWKVEKILAEKNIMFCAASGRQYYNLLETFHAARERMIFLAENGAYVMYNDKLLHCNSFAAQKADEFIRTARNIEQAYVVLCCEDSAYVESADEQLWKEITKYYKRISLVDDLTEVGKPVLKISICDFKQAEKNSLNHYKSVGDEFRIAIAGKIFLDIMHKDTNKGEALKVVQNKFGISCGQTLAFGDYLNDKEMLEAAQFNYAMKNAHPDIIKMASFVTEYDNNNNGVVDIIKKYCLNGH